MVLSCIVVELHVNLPALSENLARFVGILCNCRRLNNTLIVCLTRNFLNKYKYFPVWSCLLTFHVPLLGMGVNLHFKCRNLHSVLFVHNKLQMNFDCNETIICCGKISVARLDKFSLWQKHIFFTVRQVSLQRDYPHCCKTICFDMMSFTAARLCSLQ